MGVNKNSQIVGLTAEQGAETHFKIAVFSPGDSSCSVFQYIQTDRGGNIIFLSVTVATDGADALRRISGRRLSAAVFRDLQPPRCTGCQVTVHRARLT